MNKPANGLKRWWQQLCLWSREIRLRFDLHDSRKFKRFFEKHRCSNFAGLEDQHIQKVQRQIADIRERRAALKGKSIENTAGID